MIAGIHILQEIFAIDMLTVLKPFLEHDRKHVSRLSRFFKMETRLEFLVGCTSLVILTFLWNRDYVLFVVRVRVMKNHYSFGLSSALSLGCFICSVLLNQCNISTYMFLFILPSKCSANTE